VAKSSKDKDRRAVVEQMRREQERSEKRRTYAIIAACTVVGLVIIGLGAYPLIKENQASSGDLETIGATAGQAGCQEITTEPAEGVSDHKPVGEKIFYDNAPPAFGPHYPAAAPFGRKFYAEGDRPQVEYLVHNLEHGYTILWYDETVAENDDLLTEVKAIASKFEDSEQFEDKFIAAPWTADDGEAFPDGTHVALTHWSVGREGSGEAGEAKGIWQYCSEPSGEAVADFMEQYPYTDSPEPNAA
jgi:hypothetical protein